MAVFVARALVGGDDYVPIGPAEATFSDVPSTGFGEYGTQPYWAYDYIEYSAANDIVQGYWDGTYHPEEPVSRAQMAVYIARAVAGGDGGVPEPTGGPTFPEPVLLGAPICGALPQPASSRALNITPGGCSDPLRWRYT
jgi:hypothetical protein